MIRTTILFLFILVSICSADDSWVITECDFGYTDYRSSIVLATVWDETSKKHNFMASVVLTLENSAKAILLVNHQGRHKNLLQVLSKDTDNDGIDEIFIGKVTPTVSKSTITVSTYQFNKKKKSLFLIGENVFENKSLLEVVQSEIINKSVKQVEETTSDE